MTDFEKKMHMNMVISKPLITKKIDEFYYILKNQNHSILLSVMHGCYLMDSVAF